MTTRDEQIRQLAERAAEAKRAARRAVAALPFEEKLRRMFQLQANLRAFRSATIVRRQG